MANPLTRPAPRFRGNHPQDWALVVLAIWLFISPWVLHFGGAAPAVVGGAANGAGIGHACWNAWILGVILVLVAISAVGRVRVNQEWLTLVLGGWIFIAPWALGFVVLPRASWDHWIVGIVVVLIALANLPMFRTVHPVGTLTPPPRQPPMT